MRFTEAVLESIYLVTAGVLLIGGFWSELALEGAPSALTSCNALPTASLQSCVSRFTYALYVNFIFIYLAIGFTYKTLSLIHI